MRIKDPIGEAEEPFNLVPLTDMVFNLLIFFMCATTFAQVEKELAVQLPKTSSFTTLSAPPKELIINIKQNGDTVVAGHTYNLSGLGDLVKETIGKSPTTAVIVRADERAIIRYFADVVRVCRQAGVQEAKIVYLDEQAKP